MRGVTDLLSKAFQGDLGALDRVEELYMSVARWIGSSPLEREIAGVVGYLRRILSRGGGVPGPSVRDLVLSAGEAMSRASMAHYLRHEGVEALGFDARALVVTSGVHGNASILEGPTRERVRALLEAASRGVVPVVEGFVGSTPAGAVTTLGRGGSDYTATMIAGLLGIRRVYLVTDVDGVYSIDPRIYRAPRLVPRLSVDEAIAASAYRVKGFNKKAFTPLKRYALTVRIGSWRRFGTEVSSLEAPPGPVGSCSPKIVASREAGPWTLIGLIGHAKGACVARRALAVVEEAGFHVGGLAFSDRLPVTSIAVSGARQGLGLEALLRRLYESLLLAREEAVPRGQA
jgi:aspartate kinase